MNGTVSFPFALFSGIAVGFVMFFIGYFFGHLDERLETRRRATLEREKGGPEGPPVTPG